MHDAQALTEGLMKSLPLFSLDTAIVGLYHPHIVSENPYAVRYIDSIIGFDEDKKFVVNDTYCTPVLYSDYFPIVDFDFERKRRTLFFLPLFFENEEVGIFLIPYDKEIMTDVYETFRVNISIAVKGVAMMSKIRALSVTDELTGLYNRRGFFDLAVSRLNFLARSNDVNPILLYLDLDGLKQINDTYGHLEGDLALAAFAEILKNTLRKDDIIGRIGGDEFVVFSTIKPDESGQQLVMRLRENIEDYNRKKLHPYEISTSIGSVLLADKTKECFEAAMLNADSYLYDEKSKKRKKRR